MIDYLHELWQVIYPGILSSVLIIFAGFLCQQFRYWRKIRIPFHNKCFHVSVKRYPNEIKHIVQCKTRRNRISFYSIDKKDNGDQLEGEFIINLLNLRFGYGYHNHTAFDGFAFTNVIIQNKNTLFVESPYIGTYKDAGIIHGRRHEHAFVWMKVKCT